MQISVFHHIWMVSDITSSDIYSAPFSILGFRGGSDGKESACNAGDLGLIPGEGRSPGEGHGNLLQYSCLGNPTDRGAWRATAHGVAKSWTHLNDYHFHLSLSLRLAFAYIGMFDGGFTGSEGFFFFL